MAIDRFSGGFEEPCRGGKHLAGHADKPLGRIPERVGLLICIGSFPRAVLPATAGRTSPVRRHGKTYESGRTQRGSSHLYDVSQTSTGREMSRAVRWANHVSWTCIRPTRQTGHASERGGGVDAVAIASTAGLVSAGDTGGPAPGTPDTVGAGPCDAHARRTHSAASAGSHAAGHAGESAE
jgi:hypothetical protein